MIKNKFKAFAGLKDEFGNRLILELDDYTDYFRDASEIKSTPGAIIFAESEKEVIKIINYCRENKEAQKTSNPNISKKNEIQPGAGIYKIKPPEVDGMIILNKGPLPFTTPLNVKIRKG